MVLTLPQTENLRNLTKYFKSHAMTNKNTSQQVKTGTQDEPTWSVNEVGTYTFICQLCFPLRCKRNVYIYISLPSRRGLLKTPGPNPILGMLQRSLSSNSKPALLWANPYFQKWEGMLFWAEPGQFLWLSGADFQQCKMHRYSSTRLSIFSNFVLAVPFFKY